MSIKTKKIVIILLTIFYTNLCFAEDESIVLVNNWEVNNLGLSILTKKDMYGNIVKFYPENFIVVGDDILIFETEINKITKYNIVNNDIEEINYKLDDLKFFTYSNNILYGRTRKQLISFNLKTLDLEILNTLNSQSRAVVDGSFFNNTLYMSLSTSSEFSIYNNSMGLYIKKISNLYEKKGFKFNSNESVFRNGEMFSPSEIKKINNKLYTNKVFSLDVETFKIHIIEASGKNDFGYILLGIDEQGFIYSTDNWDLNNIYTHDKSGKFVNKFSLDSSKYGTNDDHIMTNNAFNHLSYISPAGDIYIMYMLQEGITIVRYK